MAVASVEHARGIRPMNVGGGAVVAMSIIFSRSWAREHFDLHNECQFIHPTEAVGGWLITRGRHPWRRYRTIPVYIYVHYLLCDVYINNT